ncbi:hypothetical protein K491DRAFT_756455 [Lophiostoma macrostomum CBS 122681]|uniref:Uncharacterized protein n=1 Tax=Lophiostoma macrostomum CBS 122681 TaxID=1314788 RepID=A0A6A6TFA8_9PLEO|nr:hypothetical protein K491DRAFT_756455 [Lophiostoma macrostomum CBS 122681]
METPPGSPPKTVRLASHKPPNIWDPDDDEFPNWPQTFRTTLGTFKSKQSQTAFKRSLPRSHHDILITLNEDAEPPTFDDPHTQDKDDLGEEAYDSEPTNHAHTLSIIEELRDPSWSTPTSPDLHDRLISQFFTFKYADLPADYPARHMHVLDWRAYTNPNPNAKSTSTSSNTSEFDPSSRSDSCIVAYVRPRLCDGIATLLFETSRKCLDEFLDPRISVFEWRRRVAQADRNSSAVVRRVGGRVIAGVYRNHGFKYLWKFYIRSRISLTGKWTETFAGARGTTPVSSAGPQWDDYEPLSQTPLSRNDDEHDGSDAKYALYGGRQLAHHLLFGQFWDYIKDYGMMVEWEADGKVTRGKMRSRSNRYRDDEDGEEGDAD